MSSRRRPRLTLQKFGGPLTIEEFRNTGSLHSIVVNPPFMSRDVVYEESRSEGGAAADECAPDAHDGGAVNDSENWRIRNLTIPAESLPLDQVLCESEPLATGSFEEYVAGREAAEDEEPENDEAVQDSEDGADDGHQHGALERFMMA